MKIICPNCNSPNVVSSVNARKACAAIGVIGGAIYGFRIGAVIGPVGAIAGSVTGAFAGLIEGAIIGCKAGHDIGKSIDDHVINNHQCNDCQKYFSI